MRVTDERGSAMMEFVLSLPFLWLIIMLSIGFGAGWISKHRAAVIVREHAFLDSSNTATSAAEAELLDAVRLSGGFSIQPTGAGLNASGLDKVLELLGKASSAHKVCFDGQRELSVRPLPSIPFTECFEVDSNFWTYEETKDRRAAIVAGAIGGGMFFGILGGM